MNDDMKQNNQVAAASGNASAPNPYDQIQHAAITPTRFDDRMAAAMDPNQSMTMNFPTAAPAPVTTQSVDNSGKVSVALAVVLGLVAVAGLAFGIWGVVSSVMANNTYENLESKINALQTEVTNLNQNITLNLENNQNNNSQSAGESERSMTNPAATDE